ncbi:MAG: hypothetical protein LBG87_02695 [Spirochaetaceae bacterium]|jgi:hypothetical protein|nr:hypothetical protein [Spirochaetaceae bacterium]
MVSILQGSQRSAGAFGAKALGLGVILLVLTVCGCTSTSPVLYTDNPKKDFTILGEVAYESKKRTGFQELLNAAKKQYPNCDYVIDVMVDKKRTVFLFFVSNSYTMRGTAIQYAK